MSHGELKCNRNDDKKLRFSLNSKLWQQVAKIVTMTVVYYKHKYWDKNFAYGYDKSYSVRGL